MASIMCEITSLELKIRDFLQFVGISLLLGGLVDAKVFHILYQHLYVLLDFDAKTEQHLLLVLQALVQFLKNEYNPNF